MSRVFWDTNLFVYLIEDRGELSERVAVLRGRMIERGDQLLTSTLTLGELLVKPLELRREDLRAAYESAVRSTAMVLPFDAGAAATYARIRSAEAIKPPDAIQLACAAQGRTDLFLTNDQRLSRARVEGVGFVTSLDRSPI